MKKSKIQVNLVKLEPIDELTTEELEFHHAMMSSEAELHNDAKTINKYAEIFKNKV